MKVYGKRMIAWYEKNKRDLPWRQTRDPYRIWLSEIILQQTRVDQGMDYYLKFLELFPKVQDLANAPEDKVLKAWQGLGYYSRARNLHASAKWIVHEGDGIFPKTAARLLDLKGVGPYTAAAIASFCYDEVTPVVDGNVIRVLSRLFAVKHAADTPQGRKEIETLANDLIQGHAPAEFNQAIMEFGALQCVPVKPLCSTCVLSNECLAHARNEVALFPVKKKRTVVQEVWFYYFHVKHGSKLYLKKRDEKGIWRGLYDFPVVESEKELKIQEVIDTFLRKNKLTKMATVGKVSQEYLHLLSHRKIKAVFIEIKLVRAWTSPSKGCFQISKLESAKLGVPRLIDRYMNSQN